MRWNAVSNGLKEWPAGNMDLYSQAVVMESQQWLKMFPITTLTRFIDMK
jgi:hypothetical protein